MYGDYTRFSTASDDFRRGQALREMAMDRAERLARHAPLPPEAPLPEPPPEPRHEASFEECSDHIWQTRQEAEGSWWRPSNELRQPIVPDQ